MLIDIFSIYVARYLHFCLHFNSKKLEINETVNSQFYYKLKIFFFKSFFYGSTFNFEKNTFTILYLDSEVTISGDFDSGNLNSAKLNVWYNVSNLFKNSK